jgi:biotin transport system substrate-specific component
MSSFVPLVLSDILPTPARRRYVALRSAALVVGAALLTAIAAQITIHLPFTPVPLTGQTFAVLLSGTVLGSRRGMASQALYWAMGAVGLPFYSAGQHGWHSATGSTFGYFVGFVLAAGITGWFASRRADRNIVTSLSSMALGTAIIYICGAAWLSYHLQIPLAGGDSNALSLGVTPFLAGDMVKMAVAATISPVAWQVFGGRGR